MPVRWPARPQRPWGAAQADAPALLHAPCGARACHAAASCRRAGPSTRALVAVSCAVRSTGSTFHDASKRVAPRTARCAANAAARLQARDLPRTRRGARSPVWRAFFMQRTYGPAEGFLPQRCCRQRGRRLPGQAFCPAARQEGHAGKRRGILKNKKPP